ncbi:acyltransferase [Erythrobacter sp. YT30]|uniref:acyltransferase family protein n=1 Tax=Erythrobacter sp. YT30 TaxID=1735012 RepID=UPI00076BFDE6|nr:acyltransferase [Erythrobacter sp. YT30]KWV90959.1 hypothetical protein AUC45_06395 [Erythrobacter sp. YT30]
MIRTLHGLRGVAALSVLFAHATRTQFDASLGVMLFFILSGFLMARLYMEKPATLRSIAQYAIARLARIYPLFALVIIGTAVLNYFTGANIFWLDIAQVSEHLMLYGSAYTVWTIAVEFHFYGAFVLMWVMRGKGWLTDTALYAAAAIMVVVSFLVTDGFAKISLLRYFHVFLIGMIVGVIAARAGSRSVAIANWLMPCLLIAYFIIPSFISNPVIPGSLYADPVTLLICAGLVWTCAIGVENRTSQILSSPLLYWLGEISFGLYLLHRHAIWFVKYETGGFGNAALNLAAILVLTAILAQIAYVCIEQPARKYLRKSGDALLERHLPASSNA